MTRDKIFKKDREMHTQQNVSEAQMRKKKTQDFQSLGLFDDTDMKKAGHPRECVLLLSSIDEREALTLVRRASFPSYP